MKIPREITTYCPKCNKHTPHTVSLYKAGKRRALARGERHHERVDRHGYGGSKAPIANPVKTTKKQTIKLKCKVCGFTIVKEGLRLRKLEIKT
ncbi:50S ribosomal protein L44e [archaeon]|jgi:large subunit ribosomal protein L44e|nr:50S ribosomal protein L44e [archaeon]NHV05864.1 50S ribosomal protein L44e [Nitrososphaerota archaeon]